MASGTTKDVRFSEEDAVQTETSIARTRGTSSYAHFDRDCNARKAAIDARSGVSIAMTSPRGTSSTSLTALTQGSALAAKSLVSKVLHRQPRESRGMAETLNPVERDGLVENIYELLRCTTHSRDHPRFTALRVPDTIIIRNGLIYKWYFTSKNGSVMRKNRARLHRKQVLDTLLAKGAKNRSNIVAVYLTSTSARVKPGARPGDEENSRPPSPTTPGRPEDIKTHTPVVHCDYLDVEQLRLFLDDDVLQRNGVLQAFVEPNTDNMSTIEATFSPAATLIERRINVNKIDDYRFSAVERMVTFDGADHFSDIVPVQRPKTVAGLKDGCRAIKDHIAGVGPFYLDVGRMVLYLREDKKRQLWLLWCTSFRCTPRPDDPKVANHGPIALHTRLTVDNSGEEGSTRRREQAAGVGCANLAEKTRVPTTGIVVQDPGDALREWGPEVATEKITEEQKAKAERRHLLYNIPPVGLLDVLFEPGSSLGGRKAEGYVIKDHDDEDQDAAVTRVAQKRERERHVNKPKSAPPASSVVTKISQADKQRSTRLTKGMQLASGDLYNDAFLICQTAPDLESLKSKDQRHSERRSAAQTLWNVTDEKARERAAVRDKLLAEQEEKKKMEQNTYNVRMLKKHRGVDGVNPDTSVKLQDLAPAAGSDHMLRQSPPGDEIEAQNSDIAPSSKTRDQRVDAKAGENEILSRIGYGEQTQSEIDPEVQRELEMLRGLPRNHPTMLEFIRRQRQRIAKGENLKISTDDSKKKAAERQERITRASMGRTNMEAQSPGKISKAQMLEVTRRHTNKLPKRRPQESAKRPGSAPATNSATTQLAGAEPGQVTDKINGTQTTGPRRRVRPVSANVSATTAAKWGVHARTVMVDEAVALQNVAAQHAKALKAAEESVPKPQRPLWKAHESTATSSGAGGMKQVARMRARSAGTTRDTNQQKVPVPPTAEKGSKSGRSMRPESAPSGRTTDPSTGRGAKNAEQRRAAAEQRYRELLGYEEKPVCGEGDKKNNPAVRPPHQHRQVVPCMDAVRCQTSARPSSGTPMSIRPASARPISSAFGDSDPAARGHTGTTKRRPQSARVRDHKTTALNHAYGGRGRARPQSALVAGKSASPRIRQTAPNGDAWLENVLAETQLLIASVKQDQELYSAEADALQGQLYERTGMNVAAYHHVRVPQ